MIYIEDDFYDSFYIYPKEEIVQEILILKFTHYAKKS